MYMLAKEPDRGLKLAGARGLNKKQAAADAHFSPVETRSILEQIASKLTDT